MQNSFQKALAGVGVVVTTLFVGAAAAMAQDPAPSDPSDTVGTEITSVGSEALQVWPAALAAGIALMAVVVVIAFGKRIFRRSN